MITALAGGVGAARLLAGLVRVVDPSDVTVVVNTGDDAVLHGLHISPDIDTVLYTLAGVANPETGWGIAGDTWEVMAALEAYGGETWFRLGDRDLATHLYRTHRLGQGAPLSQVTSELARAWKLRTRLIPMSDDPLRTYLELESGAVIGFQEYFVRLRHAVVVRAVEFRGAGLAAPAPGVVDAIASAKTVIVCPSNPVLSIGPILAVPSVREALEARREDAVAVSPIVAGAALKGPADRLMAELGHEASAAGIARIYAPYVAALVIDEADAALADAVAAEGVRCVVAPTIMSDADKAAELARVTLAASGGRSRRQEIDA